MKFETENKSIDVKDNSLHYEIFTIFQILIKKVPFFMKFSWKQQQKFISFSKTAETGSHSQVV